MWAFSLEGIFGLSVLKAQGTLMAPSPVDTLMDSLHYSLTGVSAEVLIPTHPFLRVPVD